MALTSCEVVRLLESRILASLAPSLSTSSVTIRLLCILLQTQSSMRGLKTLKAIAITFGICRKKVSFLLAMSQLAGSWLFTKIIARDQQQKVLFREYVENPHYQLEGQSSTSGSAFTRKSLKVSKNLGRREYSGWSIFGYGNAGRDWAREL